MYNNKVFGIIALISLLVLFYYQIKKTIALRKKIKNLNKIISQLNHSNKTEITQQINTLRSSFSDWNLLILAHRFKWEKRIVNNLPKLFFEKIDKYSQYIIWKRTISFFPDSIPFKILDEYCDGEVVSIKVEEKDTNLIRQLINKFEMARIKTPFLQDSSLNGVIYQALIEFELETKEDTGNELISDIKTTRKKYYRPSKPSNQKI